MGVIMRRFLLNRDPYTYEQACTVPEKKTMSQQMPGANHTMTNVRQCRTLDVSNLRRASSFAACGLSGRSCQVQEQKLLTRKIHGGLTDLVQDFEMT